MIKFQEIVGVFVQIQMRILRGFKPIVPWHKPRERTLLHMQDKKVLAIILSKLHISYSSMIMRVFFLLFSMCSSFITNFVIVQNIFERVSIIFEFFERFLN